MNGEVVVADVGGTNARFAIADATLGLRELRTYRTPDFADAADLLETYLADSGARAAALSIAVAGVVRDARVRVTNGSLLFDAGLLSRRFAACRVMNDFVAASLGVPHVAADALVPIGRAVPREGTKAVIGPGTGLGMGILVATPNGHRALPSEGGHGELASTDPFEYEIHQILATELPFVSWECVLSGPGLVRLYRAVSHIWGAPPRWSEPAEITAQARDALDPVCHQTLELFCNLLGSAAGSLALTVCAEGGVYLCGGIVPQIVEALAASRFRRRFENRGPLGDYAARIASVVVTHPHLGLLGAAAAHRQAGDV